MQVLDINQIKNMLPHRYPFLLLDRVIDLVPGESATGIKMVSVNEPQFQGHFPAEPVFPGVYILEAMAQTAGVCALSFLGEEAQGSVVYFMGIDGAKFRKPVTPGDKLEMKLTKVRGRGAVWKFDGEAFVDGQLVAEATLTAMLNTGKK